MKRFVLAVAAGVGGLVGLAVFPVRAQTPTEPGLVVLIAVDQMRGDYLDRFAAQWTGGFKRFRETGTFFPHGRQDHASTETAPGHSTMLSGREPGHTGIILNNRGVQDPTSPALEVPDKQGSSPRRFQGTTLYDWLLARDPDTRVLSVSRKDRGAIFPVGRGRGNVYWWLGGQFTTSRYYSDTLPRWVSDFNARLDLKHIAGSTWNLLLPASAYAEPDSMAFENAGSDFTFPHQLPGADVIAGRITSYPVMDSLTLALTLSGVEKMRLGTRGRPDLLVVSLSTTDTGAARLWRRLLPVGYGWLAVASVRPNYVWSSGSLGAEHGGANAEDIEVPIAFFGTCPVIRTLLTWPPLHAADAEPRL